MIQRQMWASLGLGALSIAFIALPGSSNATKNSLNAAPSSQSSAQDVSRSQIRVNPKVQIQTDPEDNEVIVLVDDAEDSGTLVRGSDDPKVEDDENQQIFMGSGGGWLGVGVAEVSSDKMKALKLPEERGAVLGKIVPESPAAEAGLKENDVVLEINGQRIEGTEQFRRMIHEIPAGRTANLTVWRDGRSQNIKVTLGKQDTGNMKVFAGGPGDAGLVRPGAPAHIFHDFSGAPATWN
jgi:hypothetical protein